MSARAQIPEHELHAFIDGEIEHGRRDELEALINQDEELRRRVTAFQLDKARLAQIHRQLLHEPVPEEWVNRIERGAARPRQYMMAAGAMMALAATLILIIAGGITYQQLMPGERSIVEEALAARSGAFAANRTIAVNGNRTGASSVPIGQILNVRARPPDLSAMGYRLSGIRIYGGVPGGRAVELVYRRRSGSVFALYLRRPTGEPRFDQFKRGDLRICIWQDDVLGAVMTGEMSAAEMQRLASLAYTGLES